MNYDNMLAGALIRNLRKDKGLSQEVLSGLAGVSRSHLAMIENGKKQATVKTLWAIAEALQMPLSQFFYMIENQSYSNGGTDP